MHIHISIHIYIYIHIHMYICTYVRVNGYVWHTRERGSTDTVAMRRAAQTWEAARRRPVPEL